MKKDQQIPCGIKVSEKTSYLFECPKCNGCGELYHDPYGEDFKCLCNVCKGTKEVPLRIARKFIQSNTKISRGAERR